MKYTYPEKTLPAGRAFAQADALSLRVLACVISEGEWDSADIDRLAATCGCVPSRALAALESWQSAGILTADALPVETVEKKPLRRAAGVSERSGEDVARILRERALASTIDACQQISGKVYNTGEIAILASLVEELDVDGEYLVTLLTYCVNNGKKTLRYLEKTAFGLYDEGVTNAEELNAYLRRREQLASTEGKMRTMFGIGTRALSKREREAFERWTIAWEYDESMIGLAYDLTVDATGAASVPYADKILADWHEAGVKTEEDAAARINERRTAKAPARRPRPAEQAPSFKPDDFFDRAIRRSYGQPKQ